jgi:NAD(P)-dependent dehydrogenase (short-subunit alcohol dehydrogenase family)
MAGDVVWKHRVMTNADLESNDGVVVVTGASRGIGAATAVLLAKAGLAVCVNYRSDKAAADGVVRQCQSLGVAAIAHRADVSNESQVVNLFETAERDLGPITGLVNNAGVLGTQGRFAGFDIDRLRSTIDVNVLGAMLCAREAIRLMEPRKTGSIVNVGSRASVLGSANEYVDYAATKGAIDSLTIGLANELGPIGIRVNAVRPGLIRTDIHASGGDPGRVDRLQVNIPMRRGGEAEEVARAIVWLLSDEASYVSGSFVDVSGAR